MRRARLSLLLIACVGCSSFTAETSDGGADGAAPVDGGPGRVVYAESFTDGKGSWSEGGDAARAIRKVEGADCLNGGCLEVRIDGSTAYLYREVPPGARVTVSAWMRITKAGTGSVDLFGLKVVDEDLGSWVVSPPGGGYVVESASASGEKSSQTMSAKFTSWTRITMTVEKSPPKLSWVVAGDQGNVALPDDYKNGSLVLEVGARYTKGITEAWRVLYDDIEIKVE